MDLIEHDAHRLAYAVIDDIMHSGFGDLEAAWDRLADVVKSSVEEKVITTILEFEEGQ